MISFSRTVASNRKKFITSRVKEFEGQIDGNITGFIQGLEDGTVMCRTLIFSIGISSIIDTGKMSVSDIDFWSNSCTTIIKSLLRNKLEVAGLKDFAIKVPGIDKGLPVTKNMDFWVLPA